jgi:hypothetical protein
MLRPGNRSTRYQTVSVGGQLPAELVYFKGEAWLAMLPHFVTRVRQPAWPIRPTSPGRVLVAWSSFLGCRFQKEATFGVITDLAGWTWIRYGGSLLDT